MLEGSRFGAVTRRAKSVPGAPLSICPPAWQPRYKFFATVQIERLEGARDQNCILVRVFEKLLFHLPALRKRAAVGLC